MKHYRVAINGLGRIGRLVLRTLSQRPEWGTLFDCVAVNDLASADNLSYLLQYDSTHGRFPGDITHEGSLIKIKNQSIHVYSEKDPQQLPWKKDNIDIVIEATGLFTSAEAMGKHLFAGAQKVLLSAPVSKDDGNVPTLVMGVNHKDYDPKKHHLVSNASCTTNCLAPMVKVLEDSFGIEEALMSTVHAVTATQPTVDGTSKKDWRGGRGAYQNIIPASTGAAKALALCMPQLKGKITGMSFRVPVADVSAVDLSVRLKKPTSYEKICEEMRKAAQGPLKGILHVSDELLVSSDFIGNPHSCILDVDAGIALNDHFFKLVAWYDNEMGYSHRVCDLLIHMLKCQP
jgi:glyceraldehyde 3-phosphate dehydrogenase